MLSRIALAGFVLRCCAVLSDHSTTARAGEPWPDAERPYRVAVTLPKEKQARPRVLGSLPLDFAGDLRQLGLKAAVDPTSLRLMRGGAAVPVRVENGRVEWADAGVPANQEVCYKLYFRTGTGNAPSPAANLRIPDYATDECGHPWDFENGDDAGIDSWGNKPNFIRHTVENGLLKLDVERDPYFIWGVMWGPPHKTKRPVHIDLARYPVLEMRVRQNVPHAKWLVYGRPEGRDDLLRHIFYVHGTQWQTIRIDLQREANWHGILTAFRIDPVKETPAHVEIDWIRLTPLVLARREAVELRGEPDRLAARVSVNSPPNPFAGSRQLVTVEVHDADRKPSGGQPVLLMLGPGSGGSLEADSATPSLKVGSAARRTLTRRDGTATFQYNVTKHAGEAADRFAAAAEFSQAPNCELAVSVRTGPPHHYVVEPTRPKIVGANGPPLLILARLTDEFDNTLQAEGRTLTWSTDSGKLDADGFRAAFVGDPAKSWVSHVTVRDNRGLTGTSAPIITLPAGEWPDRVRLLPNGYFAGGGKSWIPLGGFYANWVQVPTPDGEWDKRIPFTDASDEQTIAWLKFLKSNGVTALRFMLRTHRRNGMEPMDVGGRINADLFAAFMHYLDLARPFGFKFLLVIHEDYSKPCYFNRSALETFCLPHFAGENLDILPPFQRRFVRDRDLLGAAADKYTDPDAIACQDQYARAIVKLFKDNPLLFAYELENEMVGCPAAWANHAIETIRSVDPQTPVCVSHGGGGLQTADPAWWKAKTTIDFYTYHLYPHGTTSPEIDYGLITDVLTRYGRMGKPAFLGESAGDQFSYGPEREIRRWTMRDLVWFSLINGNPGCFFWNARASEMAEFKQANEIAGRIDWTTFHRKKPAIAIRVPHPLDDDRWFRSPSGKAAIDMMARYVRHYLERGVDFDFTLENASSYAAKADCERFAPPDAPAADFAISPGFHLASLVRVEGNEALVYVRNFAGVKLWEMPKAERWKQYLRDRRPAPLKVTVRLPGDWQADIWDLDTAKHETREAATGNSLDLGSTDHDFALHLRRK